MRRARLTYQGAYHHVMNRGILGEKIFPDARARKKFIELLEEKTVDTRMNLLAYCVLSNHYHLVVQNSSGQLSDFIKRLAGAYAGYYRLRFGGKGYVFQNRYKSTLVQEDNYLMAHIVYVLMNSVRAGLVKDPFEYKWSSINEYFSGHIYKTVTNRKIVEDIFGDKVALRKIIAECGCKELDVKLTRAGQVLGSDEFIRQAFLEFDRRMLLNGTQMRRKRDYLFASAESILKEFERKNAVKIEMIDTKTMRGKKLRAGLLTDLKDNAGLKYTDIQKIPIFKGLQLSSMSTLYRRAKKLAK